jgi:hypothetical protein
MRENFQKDKAWFVNLRLSLSLSVTIKAKDIERFVHALHFFIVLHTFCPCLYPELICFVLSIP